MDMGSLTFSMRLEVVEDIKMDHPTDSRLCSPGIFRLVLFLLALCLVGYSVRRQLFWHLCGRASCSWCDYDCSSKSTLPLPVGYYRITIYQGHFHLNLASCINSKHSIFIIISILVIFHLLWPHFQAYNICG